MNSNNIYQPLELYACPRHGPPHPNNCSNGVDELAYTPLQHAWSLWYFEYNVHRKWRDMLTHLQVFDDAELFWLYYDSLCKPSQLNSGTGYSLFKKDIHPMWEHPANKNGGRIIIRFNYNSLQEVDDFWLNLMLCLIGNIVDSQNEICGAVLSVYRREVKMAVWTTNCDNSETNNEIARKLCEQLHLDGQNLSYQSHSNAKLLNQAAIEREQQSNGRKAQD